MEQRAIPRAMRMRLGRGSGAVGRRMRWMRLRDRVGHEAGCGSRPDRRADQKCAATFVRFAHMDSLPIGPLWGPPSELAGSDLLANKRMRLFARADKFMGQPT